MGTAATIVLPGEPGRDLLGRVVGLLRSLERLLTVNGSDEVLAHSQVHAINAAAGRGAVVVDPVVYELVRAAVLTSRNHRDSFNALIGPVVKAWRIGFPDARVPSDREIANLLRLTDPNEVDLDDARGSVGLQRPGMQLDLGAIAKGYAADRAADLLRARGVRSGLVDLGGNVVAIGASDLELGNGWRVGIQSPFAPRGTVVGSIEVRDASAVTSGIYERVLDADGRRFHHMIDPSTGHPFDTDLASVTVIAESSMRADVWATIAQTGGLATGLAAVRAEAGVEALFITTSGQVHASSAGLAGGLRAPTTAPTGPGIAGDHGRVGVPGCGHDGQ